MINLRRFFSDQNTEAQRGQSLVEFALLMPIMLLIITGLFDVARAVWQENTLAYSAREGTRFAIVHGSAGQGPLPDGWAWGAADPTDVNDHVIGYVKTVVKQAAIGKAKKCAMSRRNPVYLASCTTPTISISVFDNLKWRPTGFWPRQYRRAMVWLISATAGG